MSESLYKVTCTPECGFSVTSHDKTEVVALAKEHGQKVHKLDMPDAEVENMVETTSV